MLISDPKARADRGQEKRQIILRFLVDEVWSSAQILGQVAGIVARQAVHRTLTAMAREGLIRKAESPTLEGQGTTLWGITPHGRALTPDADPAGHTFEPSKLSLDRVPHQLALQRIRLAAEAAGWTGWTRGETLGKDVAIRPDAMAVRPDGYRMAIECERTIKTAKRYQQIVTGHLRAIRAGDWVGVYYVSPAPVAAGLERMFLAIERLPGGIPWDEAGRKRFRILPFDQWPPQKVEVSNG